MDCNNYIRVCNLSRNIFIYWCQNIYIERFNFTDEQIKQLEDVKKTYASWLISTSGYFDKSIKGNWPEWNSWIKQDSMAIIDTIDDDEIIKSNNFFEYTKKLYNVIINRKNDNCVLEMDINGTFPLFHKEIDIFSNFILRNSNNKEEIKKTLFRGTPQGAMRDSLFKNAFNKNIVIINLYADVIRDHYNSGKVKEWYKKHQDYDGNIIIPQFNIVSSIEIAYPFGNGMNITECQNFFEMLEIIKTKIDNHPYDFDIAIISAGAYTPFICEFIETRGKQFYSFGRSLNHIFCVNYQHLLTWETVDFVLKNKLNYSCSIPDRYRLPGYKGVENGGYW